MRICYWSSDVCSSDLDNDESSCEANHDVEKEDRTGEEEEEEEQEQEQEMQSEPEPEQVSDAVVDEMVITLKPLDRKRDGAGQGGTVGVVQGGGGLNKKKHYKSTSTHIRTEKSK